MKTTCSRLLLCSVVSLASTVAQAQPVYFSDDFDLASPASTSANYNMVSSHGFLTNRVTYGWDYSALGIPSAPHSVGGSTLGLKMEANVYGGAAGAIVVSPITLFSGDFHLKFDMWMNAVGPFPGGGTGSTEALTAGVGWDGSTYQNASSGSGVWFAVDAEGGNSANSTTQGDFQTRIGATIQATNSGVYAAGLYQSRDNANAYYASTFPGGQTPPYVQTNLVAGQTGSLAVGTVGFTWCDVDIMREGDVLSWMINGLLISTVTNSAAVASDQVFVGYWDPFSSSLGNTNVSFGLVDNLRVVSTVPEPATTALVLVGLGVAGLVVRSRRR